MYTPTVAKRQGEVVDFAKDLDLLVNMHTAPVFPRQDFSAFTGLPPVEVCFEKTTIIRTLLSDPWGICFRRTPTESF